jgi:hypothetical protein
VLIRLVAAVAHEFGDAAEANLVTGVAHGLSGGRRVEHTHSSRESEIGNQNHDEESD